MASLVGYCEAGNDHDTNPLSFRLPYIGRDTISSSRKREIDVDKSATDWAAYAEMPADTLKGITQPLRERADPALPRQRTSSSSAERN